MKNFLFLALACLLITLNACNNNGDDDGISVGNEGDCSASWEVDGESFSESDMALCVYLDNTLNLSASTTGGDFQLQINPITTTGTYVADINNQDVSVIVLITLSDGRQIGSADAEVVVTELSSSRAKGTFSGNFFDLTDINLTPQFSVTNGKFESSF